MFRRKRNLYKLGFVNQNLYIVVTVIYYVGVNCLSKNLLFLIVLLSLVSAKTFLPYSFNVKDSLFSNYKHSFTPYFFNEIPHNNEGFQSIEVDG